MKYLVQPLLLLLFYFNSSAVFLQNEKKTMFTKPVIVNNNANYFNNTSCYSILTDEDGYIWVATSNGLKVYDGIQFRDYKIPCNNQEVVVLTKDGPNILAYNYLGDIVIINSKSRTSFLLKRNEENDSEGINFTNFITTNKCNYFYRPRGSCWYMDKQPNVVINDLKNLSSIYFNKIQGNSAEILSTILAIKFSIKEKKFYNFLLKKIKACGGSPIIKNDYISFGTDIYQMSDQGLTKIFDDHSRKNDHIMSFMKNGSELWVSFASGGLYYYNQLNHRLTNEHTNRIELFKGLQVTGITTDFQNNVLVSTMQNGLFYIDHSSFERLSFYDMSDAKKYFSPDIQYIDINKEELYIGYNLPVVDMVKNNGSITRYTAKNKKDKSKVRLFSKNNIKVYLASDRLYYAQQKKDNTTFLNLSSALAIKDAYRNNDTVYIKFKYHRLNLIQINKVKDNIVDTALPINSNTFCLSSADRKYYYNNATGLYRDTQKIYKDLFNEYIVKLRNYGGKILVGTVNGLWIIDDLKYPIKISKVPNTELGYCEQIAWDGADFYYYFNKNTIYKIDARTLQSYPIFSREELPENFNINCFAQHNHTLYIGTNKGIIIKEEQKKEEPFINPIIHIINMDSVSTNFLSDKTTVHYNEKLALNFRADILNYINSDYDIKWYIEDTKNSANVGESQFNNAEFTIPKLAPGSYKLKLIVSNKVLKWRSEQLHTLVILPLWWQTTSVKFMFSIIIALCSFIIFEVFRNLNNRKAHQKLKAEIRLYELESRSVLGQLNPHFIFNALTPLQNYFLSNDKRGGIEYLDKFSKLMRMQLENIRSKQNTIKEEILFLQNYLDIQQKRFNQSFEYQIKIDPALPTNVLLAPMLIQPIVENAVEHGIDKNRKDGQINVSIKQIEKSILIEVSDNGNGLPKNWKMKDNHALQIIDGHIELIRKETGIGSLSIKQRTDEKGVIASIVLPLRFK